jgi:hypothetical protein
MVTWDASTFVTYQINAIGTTGLEKGEVLLDNQADVSIMHPSLLRAIKRADSEIRVNGVGGVQLVTNRTGYLQDFFRVYTSTDTRANVLSFADVEDMYDVTYEKGKSFTVHLPDRDIVFYRKKKLYVADFSDLLNDRQAFLTTYTKGQEARAKIAYDFVRRSGYPSLQEAIHLVQDGNMTHMPGITSDDITRAFDIFGEPVGSVRGKMTRRPANRAIYDDNLLADEKKQVLHSYVMHIDHKKFLVTVSVPLHLTMQCPIERETANSLGIALQGQLELLRSRGFVPVRVHMDPQSAFRALTTSFENVVIDAGGAQDFVPVVDAKIRRVKEIYRAVKSTLPWPLLNMLVQDLVAYVVSRFEHEAYNGNQP